MTLIIDVNSLNRCLLFGDGSVGEGTEGTEGRKGGEGADGRKGAQDR